MISFHRLRRNLLCGAFVCFALGLPPTNLAAQPATGITVGGKVAAFSVDDIITKPLLDYPYEARRSNQRGVGLYRVLLEPKTGWARSVMVIKSTGWTSLDQAAISGLRELRVKPGKWKQVDFPVDYSVSESREEAMEKIRRLRAQDGIK